MLLIAESPTIRDVSVELLRLAEEEGYLTARVIRCVICDLDTFLVPGEMQGRCPHCGTSMAAAGDRQFVRPFGYIPFKISGNDAVRRIQDWQRKFRWAAGGLRRKLVSPENIQAVYLSYWIFDAVSSSRYRGGRSLLDPEETASRFRKGKKGQPALREPVSGVVKRHFSDMVVPGGGSIPPKILGQLQDWNLKGLRPFKDSIVKTAQVECDQLKLDEAFKVARAEMDEQIKTEVNSSIGGDSPRVEQVKTEFEKIALKHLLMPVWVSACRYGEETIRIIVDAQNGRVYGQLPTSPTKIATAIAGGVVGALTLGWLLFL